MFDVVDSCVADFDRYRTKLTRVEVVYKKRKYCIKVSKVSQNKKLRMMEYKEMY